MKKGKTKTWMWILILGFCLFINAGFAETFFSGGEREVTYDSGMRTTEYQMDITVREDNSYLIEETIDVVFLENRHGIYRYIPMKDTSMYRDEKGKIQKEPYYAKVELLEASAPVEVYEESGNTVFRLGSEDETFTGMTSYRIRYLVTPQMQHDTYANVYYNIFPHQWQNEIPAGSRFSITFPREFHENKLQFYSGSYGSDTDATPDLWIETEGLTVRGTLLTTLGLGEGLTFFLPVGEAYFTEVHTMGYVGILLLVTALVLLLAVVLLFVFFGRDAHMYPSIQQYPPDGLDSAAVGYIIDGSVEDRDVLSLIIYWADEGYLTIYEREKENMILRKRRNLRKDVPAYEQTLFRELFKKGDEVSIQDLEYQFAETLKAVKLQVKTHYSSHGQGGIYTGASRVARGIATLLCILPFGAFVLAVTLLSPTSLLRGILHVGSVLLLLAGVCIYNYAIDNWYSKKRSDRKYLVVTGLVLCFAAVAAFSGSYVIRALEGEVFSFLPAYAVVLLATGVMVWLTGFMKKRTAQCIEWMGRLVGLRDFIETAELERLEVLAQENPQWFYHVLPYTYVFGLSDTFAKKLEGLAVPAPEWYEPMDRSGSFWDYYMFNRCFMRNMSYASRTMTAVRPEVSASGSHGGGFGSFGGGFGGGGFSGGGFGGGGGGSW